MPALIRVRSTGYKKYKEVRSTDYSVLARCRQAWVSETSSESTDVAIPVRFHEWGSVPLFSQKKLKTPVTRKGQILLRVNKE
jgi:hypothetical protein